MRVDRRSRVGAVRVDGRPGMRRMRVSPARRMREGSLERARRGRRTAGRCVRVVRMAANAVVGVRLRYDVRGVAGRLGDDVRRVNAMGVRRRAAGTIDRVTWTATDNESIP